MSPRLRQAVRLYASGATRTQKEAAEIMGVSRVGLGRILRYTPVGKNEVALIDSEIRRRVVDLSAVIEGLGQRAIARVAALMDGTDVKHDVQLRAAQDILDRNPATSKTRRLQVESLSLTGKDVQTLVRAMTSSAELKREFPEAAIGDYTPGLIEGEVSG